MKLRFAALFLTALLNAQTPQTISNTQKGSVSGVTRDALTGAPIPNVTLTPTLGTKRLGITPSDAQGHFEIKNLDPGSLHLTTLGGSGTADKFVDVVAGQDTVADLRITRRATISGRILDQDGEPLANLEVLLIARDYAYGKLRYVYVAAAATNVDGEYQVNALPGRAYLLMARRRSNERLDALSEAPADPKNRKPAVVPTYYPGVDTAQAAQLIAVSAGEKREHIDFTATRTRSYCIEGVLGQGQTEGFQIGEHEPETGRINGGGLIINPAAGSTQKDGKFRICDLHPGTYDLRVRQSEPTATGGNTTTAYSVTTVNISDRDLSLSVVGQPQIPVPGEIVWSDGTNTPSSAPIAVDIGTLEGVSFPGELGRAQVTVPGKFSYDHLFMKEYSLDFPNGLPEGVYVKDVTYSGKSILYDAMRPGTVAGTGELRVSLGRDGGSIAVSVTDKDGKPTSDMNIAIFPDSALNEIVLAASIVSGKTSQNGTWTSPSLAPGKYYAVATVAPVDHSPESLSRLINARTSSKPIELGAGQNASLTITAP